MFFLQREVILRDLQINELTISVSDMKGKFIKPTLKKVSKYENKFAKLQEKAAKFAFQPAETVQVIPTQQLFDFHIKKCGLDNPKLLYCTVHYSNIQYSRVQYCILLYCTVQFCVVHGVLMTDSCPNRLYSVSLLLFVLLM